MISKNSIDSGTNLYCILGHPIEHSFSPIIYNSWFKDFNLNKIYLAFDVAPKNLKNTVIGFKAIKVGGFNITIPHKEKIIKYIDEIDSTAKKIGAVNTVKNEDGFFKGTNTDAIGAENALKENGFTINDKNVVILGSGGAAKAISSILVKRAKKIILINRTISRATNLAKEIKKKFRTNIEAKINSKHNLEEEIKSADILINTTPVGMYPLVNKSPILREFLHPNLFVFDIVYNPPLTQLLKDASGIGCKTLGGLDMLVNQAALAFEWWTNKKPKIELMKNKIREFLVKN